MIFAFASLFRVYLPCLGLGTHLAWCLNTFLIMKALLGNFNKDKALVGAFSRHCETSRMFVGSSIRDQAPVWRRSLQPAPAPVICWTPPHPLLSTTQWLEWLDIWHTFLCVKLNALYCAPSAVCCFGEVFSCKISHFVTSLQKKVLQ